MALINAIAAGAEREAGGDSVNFRLGKPMSRTRRAGGEEGVEEPESTRGEESVQFTQIV